MRTGTSRFRGPGVAWDTCSSSLGQGTPGASRCRQSPARHSMTEDPLLPRAPWRRPTFVCAGLALFGVGAWINADRLGLVDEPPLQLDRGEVVAAAPLPKEGKMGKASPRSKSGLYAM